HIGRALRAAHKTDRWHGDVKPSNILVDTRGDDPVFRLGDFALAVPDGGDPAISIAPRCLSERGAMHGRPRQGEWGDIAALSVVLYQMLAGEAIDRGARSLLEQIRVLRDLAATPRARRHAGGLRVIETLIQLFHDGEPIDIHEFLASLERKRSAPPERKRTARPATGEPAHAAGVGVDVGILTIRDDEFMAVLDRFPGVGTRTGRRKYRMRRLELGDGQAYSVGVVSCGEQGNTTALDTARDLLDDLAPRLLLVVGIAGGAPHDEHTLGDVVVSNRIIDLTVEAVLKDHTRTYAVSGGALHRIATDLVADLPAMVHGGELDGWNLDASITVGRPPVDLSRRNFYGPKHWRDQVHDSLHRHFVASPRSPRVTAGAIASSDRLVKESETLELWMKLARQIRAVEMESAGVYKAAHGRVPFLAIRGISDIVGFKRAPGWEGYACHSAAAFTRAFLRARPLALLAPPPAPPPVSRTSTTT
ncbi:MAG TPA: hypothetical protein VLM79_16885, partial [Kofleriaceae bacterium]|nr:hypothetical protein [Kofleriaceae bacterium]